MVAKTYRKFQLHYLEFPSQFVSYPLKKILRALRKLNTTLSSTLACILACIILRGFYKPPYLFWPTLRDSDTHEDPTIDHLRHPSKYQPIWIIYILFESPLLIDFKNARFDLNFWRYVMPCSIHNVTSICIFWGHCSMRTKVTQEKKNMTQNVS